MKRDFAWVIERVLDGIIVELPCDFSSVSSIRDEIHQQALKQTAEPIEIITKPWGIGLIVKRCTRDLRPINELKECQKSGQ